MAGDDLNKIKRRRLPSGGGGKMVRGPNGNGNFKLQKGGGSEYATILAKLSLPGGIVLRLTAGRAVAAAAVTVAAAIWQLAG